MELEINNKYQYFSLFKPRLLLNATIIVKDFLSSKNIFLLSPYDRKYQIKIATQ